MAQYVLENDLATFTFEDHATTGLRLLNFNREGGSSWSNAETKLWQATVYDTTTAPTTTTATINPTAATLGAVAVTADAQGDLIQATWTAVPVGGDSLNVTVTLRLNTDEDFLRVRITASWAAAAAYTLDSLQVLGLAIAPKNQGDDYAVVPFGWGFLSKNPVDKLRYSNGQPGFPVAGFGVSTDNRWVYPSGRGWAVGCWGYYENTTNEGWMIYLEDHSLEWFYATWQGDGTNLTWSMSQAQEDNVLVGNNSRTLGSSYTFCLRPFATTSTHGWWDIGKHYKDRIEQNPPVFFVEKRPLRSDYSTPEKAAFMPFIAIQAIDETHTPGDGLPGDIQGLLDSIRTNVGLATAIGLSGNVECPSFNINLVGEDADGDLHGKLATMYANGNNFFPFWVPVNSRGGIKGGAYPDFEVWDTARWNATLPGDHAELRLWTALSAEETFRISRRGYLEGGGADRTGEESPPYFRSRSYMVSAYTGPTRTITVTPDPSADGFSGVLFGSLMPASAAARMADARVTGLSANTIHLFTGMFNSLGATAMPAAGDSIRLTNTRGDLEDQCWHAMVNSPEYMTRLKANSSAGYVQNFRACGGYHDTSSEPLFNTSAIIRGACYRDHSSWAKIGAGYTRHPYGGGAWWNIAKREFWYQIKNAGRTAQIALGREPFYWITVEDIDETVMDRVDWQWHSFSAMALWRNTSGDDPTIHEYKAIPFFAVIYAGKTMGRAGLNQEFSSGLLDSSFHTLAGLTPFLGYCLAHEWPYGMTWPTLGLLETDTIPFANLWDNTQYVDAGGSVPLEVRNIRDQWTQMMVAESTWLYTAGFRYGDFLPPCTVNYSLTDTTTGLADDFWTVVAPFYQTGDVIYDRATFPCVTHGVWKAADGSVLVLLSNWTDATARWAGTIDLSIADFAANGRVRVRQVDYQNRTLTPVSTYTGTSILIGMNEVPGHSIRALILDQEPQLSFTSRAVLVRSRF